jgi:hypothetical protein
MLCAACVYSFVKQNYNGISSGANPCAASAALAESCALKLDGCACWITITSGSSAPPSPCGTGSPPLKSSASTTYLPNSLGKPYMRSGTNTAMSKGKVASTNGSCVIAKMHTRITSCTSVKRFMIRPLTRPGVLSDASPPVNGSFRAPRKRFSVMNSKQRS